MVCVGVVEKHELTGMGWISLNNQKVGKQLHVLGACLSAHILVSNTSLPNLL